jgi:probable F420-dependent oxidoreductase
MVELTIGLWGMPAWLEGDFPGIAGMAALADRKGVDRLDTPDHLLMSETLDAYPYAKVPPSAARAYFYEPLTLLAALASITTRIRLATGIMIAPLRPAPLLAKQAATLDLVARGRFDLGIGVGWQQEEFQAAGIAWEDRFSLMDEQIRACRALWTTAPASFEGPRIRFDKVYALPFPVQEGGIPIWYGVAPTPRNFSRIAALGVGWMASPKEDDPVKFKADVQALRAAFAAEGRDPADARAQAKPRAVRQPDGTTDIDATLALFPAFAEAGATSLYMAIHYLSPDPDDYERNLDRLIAARDALTR